MELSKSNASGAYVIRNKNNGKGYVGSSAKGFAQRSRTHRDLLKADKHHSIHLQRAWNKYGADMFEFRILEECEPSRCIEVEQKWIDLLDSANPKQGYNRCPTAGSRRGTKHTEETKAKIAKGNLGKKMSEESKALMSESRRGKTHTEESKATMRANSWARGEKAEDIAARIAKGLTGKKHSEERKALIKEGKRKHLEENGEEYRANVSKAAKESWERRRVNGTAQGHPHSEESKRKMSKKKSDAGREAINVAQQARRAKEQEAKAAQAALNRELDALLPPPAPKRMTFGGVR